MVPRALRPVLAAGAVLGMGLGGLADGIVFHLLLQWHHVASAVEPRLAANVFWDGVFHAAMGAVLVAGLALVARAARLPGGAPGRGLAAGLLLGVGAFHVLDSVLLHWVLGLHRINPHEHTLAWDLAYFAAGVLLLAAGAWLARGAPARAGARRGLAQG